jgi:hypothetical protein
MSTNPSPSATGRVLPALVLLLLLVDGATRLVPLRAFSFRAWEALLHASNPHTVFAPSEHIHMTDAYGDLAALANRRDLRELHEEDFTTDALGFRNPPDLLERGRISVLVNGNSFAAGVGLTDRDTVAAQLAARTGLGVYSVGGVPDPHVADLLLIKKRIGMDRGLVVHVYLEGDELGTPAEQEEPRYRLDQPPRSHLVENLEISRLSILAIQAQKWVRRDWGEPGVIARRLRNGETMLFPALDPERYRDTRPPRVGPWLWLRDRLAPEGLEVLVVIVPTKFTVYAPLLKRPEPPSPVLRMNRLEQELRAAGVRVVNLTGPFQRRAADDYERGEYIYWRDDTHWNRRGVELCVDAIVRALPARVGE